MKFEYLIVALAAFALLLLLLAFRQLRRRRLLRGSGYGLLAIMFASFAALAVALVLNLYTYQRLGMESPVATLNFSQLGEQHYQARIFYPDGAVTLAEIYGDEWQLDARILKWSRLAHFLGLQPLYRLERLSGRYHDVLKEKSAPRSVEVLSETAGLDLWYLARKHPRWLPFVDAVYGSATYLPMAEAAVYKVSIGHNGLLARPASEAAERAIKLWK